jgi:hypothetical protein
MTLPGTAAEVLSGHVMLEVCCIDRVMLTLRQPRLQYGQGICKFFCQHRGNRFASSALMLPMTGRFTAGIRHYTGTRRPGPGPVREGAEQGPGRQGVPGRARRRGVRLVRRRGLGEDPGVADRAAPGRGDRGAVPVALPGAGDGRPLVFLRLPAPISARSTSSSAAISPAPGRSTAAGTSTPSSSAGREGIAFTALDNAFGTVSDPAAVQRICDGLTGQKTCRFAGKWLARLPQPFTRADQDAGYRWQLPGGQAGFSTTMAPGPAGHRADLLRAADPRQPPASAARTR